MWLFVPGQREELRQLQEERDAQQQVRASLAGQPGTCAWSGWQSAVELLVLAVGLCSKMLQRRLNRCREHLDSDEQGLLGPTRCVNDSLTASRGCFDVKLRGQGVAAVEAETREAFAENQQLNKQQAELHAEVCRLRERTTLLPKCCMRELRREALGQDVGACCCAKREWQLLPRLSGQQVVPLAGRA